MSATLPNGTANGRPQQRKQLSDQLDRFDIILDGLSEGLQDAICDAAREGTRLAVTDAIREILMNPDLRAAMQTAGPASPAGTTPPTSPRSAWTKLKDLLRRARAAVVAAVRHSRTFVVNKVRAATRLAAGAGRMMISAWRVKRAVVVTAGIGVGLGTAAFYAAPTAGVVLSGAAGAVVAVTIKTAIWVRSVLRTILPA